MANCCTRIFCSFLGVKIQIPNFFHNLNVGAKNIDMSDMIIIKKLSFFSILSCLKILESRRRVGLLFFCLSDQSTFHSLLLLSVRITLCHLDKSKTLIAQLLLLQKVHHADIHSSSSLLSSYLVLAKRRLCRGSNSMKGKSRSNFINCCLSRQVPIVLLIRC